VTTTTTTAAREQAAAIRKLAARLHVAVTAEPGGAVTVYARFPAGDRDAYAIAEDACNDVLREFPSSGGSTWGTDSASVGGHVGLKGGYCRLTKSGVNRTLARQFLGNDPELTLSVYEAQERREAEAVRRGAEAARDERDERAAAILTSAYELRNLLAALGADDADDHLAHLGGQVIDVAVELGEAMRYGTGCAAELSADMASLTARVGRLLAADTADVAETMRAAVTA
jgi:hypothetical protein